MTAVELPARGASPRTNISTPMVKIENTRRHGAETIISGATLEEAADIALMKGRQIVEQQGDRMFE